MLLGTFRALQAYPYILLDSLSNLLRTHTYIFIHFSLGKSGPQITARVPSENGLNIGKIMMICT